MPFDLWLVYLIACVGLSLTPGPNGLLSLTHGARFGVRRAVFTAAGAITGFLVLIALSLAGLGALMAASEQAFTVLKWVGAGYLIWLGVRLWRAPPPSVEDATPAGHRDSRPARLFVQGFTVAVSNPKVLIFFAAFLPQFMTPGAGFWSQALVLGGTFAAIEFAYEVLLAGTAHRLAPWLARAGRWFNRVTGATFIGIGGLLTTASRSG
ncbi:LysE family translocator [Rhodospira trueperi]|uniref:Threonine/homoserine/homoserine lactone efflux protein n=1 Tax=Rhodospira trueperi TaxID=69960 RepID=A0A1G6YV73_9PROT|nr:LysE family translocator [Rhodospira trueperi]SDD93537.1 Threonine/homoserine/homoserine lactone efflux protein [Rhodospira trueperi]